MELFKEHFYFSNDKNLSEITIKLISEHNNMLLYCNVYKEVLLLIIDCVYLNSIAQNFTSRSSSVVHT